MFQYCNKNKINTEELRTDLGKQIKGAIFSPCRMYRYILWRSWGEDWKTNYAMFIGLNPSTADETQDDPTIRRCIAFSKQWGHSGLVMANLFGYRATNPKDMLNADEPVGKENDCYLQEYAANAKIVIAAWGNHGTYGGRHNQVVQMLPNLQCLKFTKAGMPGHPLYLPGNSKPVSFT